MPNSLTLQQMFVVYRGDNPRPIEPASDEAGSIGSDKHPKPD